MEYNKIFILLLGFCCFLTQAINLSDKNNNNHGEISHFSQNQDKVWMYHQESPLPEENEFLQNGLNSGNKEVFRLRNIRKEKKKREMLLQLKANQQDNNLQIVDESKKGSSAPENKETVQLQQQQTLEISMTANQQAGTTFIEVVANEDDQKLAQNGALDDEIKKLTETANKTESFESKAAIDATIQFLVEKNNTKKEKEIAAKKDWGIFMYFYNEGKCDYMKSSSLKEGQALYRQRSEDAATIFVANGEMTRTKGDQVAIECCQGKALLDGNLRAKVYPDENIYVVNHENNSIYNDVTKFSKDKMDDVQKEFNKYSADDSTIIVRGRDAQIMQKKGNQSYYGQNLAYLYNDVENKGEIKPYDIQSLAAASAESI